MNGSSRAWIVSGSLCIAVWLASCGKTQPPPAQPARTLGGTPFGAPLAPAKPDLGILQDQTTYKPASFAGGAAGQPAGKAAAPEAVAAARELIQNLLNDLESGEVDLVLEVLDPSQVGPLRNNDDFLFNTQQAYASLTRALAKKSGSSAVEQLNADLRKLVSEKLTIDPVNADTVTATPNPLWLIFGPEKTPAALTLVRKDSKWLVRLDAPLTPADVEAMGQYHTKLREALYALAEGLDRGSVEGREAVHAALLKAGAGQEMSLPAGGEAKSETQPDQKPEEKPPGP